jgi:hypothetical protein
VAIERVPPRRAAGAGLALPVFNKLCVAHLIFFRAKRGAIFRVLVILRVCVGATICGGYSFGASRILRGFGLRASGALGELRNTFEVLRFSGFSLFLFFSLSFFLHYLRINLCTFLVCVPGLFLLDLALLLNYATRGRAGGARRAGLVLLGVLAFGVVSCILFSWVE